MREIKPGLTFEEKLLLRVTRMRLEGIKVLPIRSDIKYGETPDLAKERNSANLLLHANGVCNYRATGGVVAEDDSGKPTSQEIFIYNSTIDKP